MATNPALAVPQQLEDPLVYLSSSSILEYQKGQTIYSQNQPSANVFLIIEGTVKVCRMADEGRPVVVDIYQNEEFFGESALLNSPRREEQAVAIENAKVMTWTLSEIEHIVTRRPRLAIALLQMLVQRSIDFGHRIESLSVDNIVQRLGRTLIRFAERFGRSTEDGSVEMMPLTHEVLAQYVGTSREIVTHYMNQFRRQGYLRYSRKGIFVHQDALKDWFRQNAA